MDGALKARDDGQLLVLPAAEHVHRQRRGYDEAPITCPHGCALQVYEQRRCR